MDVLNEFYGSFVDESAGGSISYVNTMAAAHTFPTDNPSVKNSCSTSSSPYISNCDYDGAGEALAAIYGPLNARNDGTLSGELVTFSQGDYFSGSIGLASTGYAYVPASCADLALCRLHISFHGCLQSTGSLDVGRNFLVWQRAGGRGGMIT